MTETTERPQTARVDFLECTSAGLLYYYLTSLIVVFGLVFGHDFLEVAKANPLAKRRDYIATFANWNGEWFTRILTEGYTEDPAGWESPVFFPAYPLLGRGLARATGLRPELALLIVSHVCLAATFVLAYAYVRVRFPGPTHAQLPGFVLLALGLFPPGFFLRMAYTESLFLLLTVLAFYGMERRWPLWAIALLAGAASSVRAVGVALAPAFALHLWRRSPSLKTFATRGALLGPLACWGILAYMLYQQLAFGDPLLFYHSEMGIRKRPEESLGSKLLSDLTLEPIWSLFDSSAPGYWVRQDVQGNPLFSLILVNPLYLLAAVTLLAVGVGKRWLTGPEIAAALFLLLISYIFKGGANYMEAMARFTAVVFPLYLVLGRLLASVSAPLVAGAAALSGFFLATYSALFAAWFPYK
jgi:hypothetical protein